MTQTLPSGPHVATAAELLDGAKMALTLMTAKRLSQGMTPAAAFHSALASFLAMCLDDR